jgi:hypothetical protein
VRGQADGPLQAGYRRFGPWTEATVDRPGPQPTPSQLALQPAHLVSTAGVGVSRPSPQHVHPCLPDGLTGPWTDYSVDRDSHRTLEAFHGRLCLRAKQPVHATWPPTEPAERSLHCPHAVTLTCGLVTGSALKHGAGAGRWPVRFGRAARDARARAREQDGDGHEAHQPGSRKGHAICPLHRSLLIERLVPDASGVREYLVKRRA